MMLSWMLAFLTSMLFFDSIVSEFVFLIIKLSIVTSFATMLKTLSFLLPLITASFVSLIGKHLHDELAGVRINMQLWSLQFYAFVNVECAARLLQASFKADDITCGAVFDGCLDIVTAGKHISHDKPFSEWNRSTL